LYKNKPIELITKQTRFYGLDYKVLKGVLVPRPDTEILCEKVIQILSKDKKLKHGVDLCCGSGNITITLKKQISDIEMDAIDIQPIACHNTKLNATKHKIKLNVINGDFYKTLIAKHLKYDFIVCNPPYVKQTELDKTMLIYENKINFNNSSDHLFFYKKIITNYQKIVNDKNHFLLAFEIGFNQKKDLKKFLLTKSLYRHSNFYKDYNGKDRVLIIYKVPSK
jgi:release factor glutamine methyltransferase